MTNLWHYSFDILSFFVFALYRSICSRSSNSFASGSHTIFTLRFTQVINFRLDAIGYKHHSYSYCHHTLWQFNIDQKGSFNHCCEFPFKMVIFSHCKDKNMNHTLDDKQNKFYLVPHPEVGLNSQKLFLLSIWL